MNPQHPAVFTVGIVLTAILSGLMLCVVLIGGILGVGFGGFAVAQSGEALVPMGFLFGVGALLIMGALIYYSAILVACSRAWKGSRGWTIALIVFSAIGLTSPGFFSLPINVLMIVGAAMVLGQKESEYTNA